MHSAGQTSEYGTQTTNKKKKLGHRRVKGDGEVTFKKIETTQLIGSIQLGVHHAVGSLANVPHRDLLMQDFMTVGKIFACIMNYHLNLNKEKVIFHSINATIIF